MVKAEDSRLFQRHSACHLPNLNCMSSTLQHGQQNVLAYSVNHCTLPTDDVAFPGFRVPGLCGLGTGQTNGVHGLFQCLPPRFDSLPSTLNPYVKEEPSTFYHGHVIKTTPNAVSGSTTQRKFVIFDQSGTHTSFFFSPLCSPAQDQIVAPTNYLDACDLRDKGLLDKMEQNFPTKPTIQGKSDENQIIGEESEMHEDTEELNALLFSDDDGEESEEDEVTSTGRSPFAIEGSYKKRKHMEEITVEVASSDSPMKRQRLIDGAYKKSSLMDVVSSAKLDMFCEYDNYAEPSHAKGRNQREDLDSILGAKQSRKDKIRETLKILESLIPGVKSKDPLLVIEEAISYLKYLKLKAKALGVS